MVRLGLARAALRRRPPRRRLVRLLLLFLRTRAVLGAVLGAIAKHAAVVHHHLLFIQIQRHRQPRVEQHVVLASPRVVPHDSAAHGLDALALDHETRANDVIASHAHPSSRGRAPTPVQTRGRRKISRSPVGFCFPGSARSSTPRRSSPSARRLSCVARTAVPLSVLLDDCGAGAAAPQLGGVRARRKLTSTLRRFSELECPCRSTSLPNFSIPRSRQGFGS